MSGAAVWPGNFAGASLTAVFEYYLKETTRSNDEIAAVQAIIIKEVPEGKREDALKRISDEDPWGEYDEASGRAILEKGSVDETTYKKSLVARLKNLAYSGDESVPYIVRGLVANGRIKDTGALAPVLVEAILKPDCPVSAALTDADKAALNKLAKEAPAPDSKS
jgi:hypothetical protein